MCLKISLSSYMMLSIHNIAWHKFCSFFLNILEGKGGGWGGGGGGWVGEREKKIVQIAVFPIIFVTDCRYAEFHYNGLLSFLRFICLFLYKILI